MWRCQSLRTWVGPEDPCGEGLELPTLAERACQEGFEFRTGEGGEAIRTCGKTELCTATAIRVSHDWGGGSVLRRVESAS